MIAKTGNISIGVNIYSLYWFESEKKITEQQQNGAFFTFTHGDIQLQGKTIFNMNNYTREKKTFYQLLQQMEKIRDYDQQKRKE